MFLACQITHTVFIDRVNTIIKPTTFELSNTFEWWWGVGVGQTNVMVLHVKGGVRKDEEMNYLYSKASSGHL